MIGLNVFIYWNFRKKCWSVRHKNKVVGYASSINLKDARFKVSEPGRQRVIASRTKNVHAGVVGIIKEIDSIKISTNVSTASYNPYKFPWFYDVSTLKLIDDKQYKMIHLTPEGKVKYVIS